MRLPALLCALLLALVAAGCVAHPDTDNRHRGFYGGVSVGGAIP